LFNSVYFIFLINQYEKLTESAHKLRLFASFKNQNKFQIFIKLISHYFLPTHQ